MRTLFITLVLVCTLLFVSATHATHAASSITNTIEIEANSGSNVVKGGRVTEGTERSSVSITTVIDGEVVGDIHETSSGAPIYIERTTYASTTDATSTTVVDLHIGASTVVTDVSTINRMAEEKLLGPFSTNTREVELGKGFAAMTRGSMFPSILETFSHIITYVLSNIFSYERAS